MLTNQLGSICPDTTRVVLRPFRIADPADEGDPNGRTARIIDRVLQLKPDELDAELSDLITALELRHGDVAATLDRRFTELKSKFDGRLDVDRRRARLIAAFFTEEFSIEAAALFNPSVVTHFDQTGLENGDTRFIMSLRGIGEGHISSLVFQTGTWRADGSVALDQRGPLSTGPATNLPSSQSGKRTAELDFADIPIGERVVYPFLPSQGRGIEDARLCVFEDDDGRSHYRGTFTAFDGVQTRQAVLQTEDFRHIVARRLDGDLASTKGAAWFPRKIAGRYMMLARLDEESVYVVASDDPDEWHGGEAVIQPRFPWEIVQMGNCGSPIEIDEGWLVLTHGVGRARTYSVGAALLDREDPTKLLARSPRPILSPNDDERGGYVPNVVYSCGAMARGRELLLPYGVADNYAAMATVDIDALVSAMV